MKIFGIEFKFNGFDIWHTGNFDPNTKVNKSGDTITGPLNVNNALSVNGYRLAYLPSNNPENGALNPLWYALRIGKKIYTDEEFSTGTNSVSVYNNSGGTGVSITRVDMTSAPNKSGKVLEIRHNGAVTSPTYGGFYQSINSRVNGIFAQVFKAKLPVGYALNTASNSQGTNSTEYWLTNNVGTGKWETYARIVLCGNTGTFSSGGHVYISGSPAPTAENNLVWHLASCTLYDLTDLKEMNADTATKLQTARTINGVSFDGSTDITITAAPTAHEHDGRYYTETESDARFAPAVHTHTKSQITDMPTALSQFTNDIGAGGGVKITTSSIAPTSPSPGDFWYKEI